MFSNNFNHVVIPVEDTAVIEFFQCQRAGSLIPYLRGDEIGSSRVKIAD
jgi:hypothetical protein